MRIKREIPIYSMLEFKELEKHLEKRAAEGWMLKKAGSLLWSYEEATPQKVHFSIVFFPKTTALEPEPSDNLIMMREFCEKTGWKLVAEIGQMQIFCNEEDNPVSIETESWIQVENIHQSAKKNVLIVYWILLINSVMQLGLQIMQFAMNPLNWLGAGYNLYLSLTWLALGIGYGVELILYYIWHKKAKRIASEEERLYLPKSYKAFRVVYLGIAFVSLVLSILALMQFTSSKYGILVLVWTMVLLGIPFGVSRFLKSRKVSAKWNRIAIVIVAIVASIGMVAYTFASIAKDADIIFHKKEMPLMLEDFKEVNHDEFVESFRISDSVLIYYADGFQAEDLKVAVAERLKIDYTIIVVKVPFLYDLCKNELLKKYDYLYENDELIVENGYKKVDDSKWNAEEVYRYHDYDGEPNNDFIVCYEDRMIQINFSWDVTDADIEKVSELISCP